MSLAAALLATLAVGLLHGLGPDHAAAILALSAKSRGVRGSLRTAARFSAGHGLVFAAASIFAGTVVAHVPATLDRWADLGSAGVAILLGAVALFSGRARTRDEPGHAQNPQLLEAGLGALFALSAVRAVALNAAVGSTAGLLLAVAFAGGMLSSMAVVAVALGALAQRFPAARLLLHRCAAALAVVLGVAWLVLRTPA